MKINTSWNWLKLIACGRVFSAITFFMYVGAMSQLIVAWHLSATQAGIIQTVETLGFALALFISSYASDFYNPNRIISIFIILNFISSFIFFYFASNFITAACLNFFVGFAQGGIYGPSILLVSEKFNQKKKGIAVGTLLGSQSLGYALSLSINYILSSNYNYHTSFFISSIMSLIGMILLLTAVYKDFFKKYLFSDKNKKFSLVQNSQTKLLITGYTAHATELFGVWSWLPIFLTIVLLDKMSISKTVLGIIIGFSIHCSGLFSSLFAGHLSDSFGRKRILFAFALVSEIFSFVIGWTTQLYWQIIIALGFIYAFFCIGDSGVLTAALTESTPKYCVGRTVGYRSIFGIGLGSITPGIFGFIIDKTNNHHAIDINTNWVYAFSFLGCAGLIATFCASRLTK